ncbi:MrcB family domain-containing protein [Paenibacillus gorillae]|uniref:MrcB family domain-containing protein n=1 Tax=Paenibacillus gorillae TaxID=1243662 RepID=UPI0004B9683F|nr:DUF3578 domain-containing protein [Paenibacillus gorillae]
MSLPKPISQMFKRKQKSYKMILILALLEELKISSQDRVSFDKVKQRFLNYFIAEQIKGNFVDKPSGRDKWADVPPSQLKDIVNSPVNALSNILFINPEDNSIGFHQQIRNQLDDNEYLELEQLAKEELQAYNSALQQFSLQGNLENIMANYVQAKSMDFKGHPLGALFRQTLPTKLKALPFLDEQFYKFEGSIGKGNWADVPWLAVLDKRITDSIQRGEYVVYLFAKDMSAVYLTLAQGVTAPKEKGLKEAYTYLRNKTNEIREIIPLEHMNKDENIQLKGSGLGQDYQVSTIAYVKYERGKVPSDEQLILDLQNVVENYRNYVEGYVLNETASAMEVEHVKEYVELASEPIGDNQILTVLQQIKNHINRKGFFFPEMLIENFYLALKAKPFVILAGISGTGKTRLVKLFAEALGATRENGQYTLIQVRPDWSDPSDLLGFKDLSGRFQPGPLTKVFVEARQPENQNKPYFVCLDEMNLARVEHYFSDLLSVLETQDWQEESIRTQSLLSHVILDFAEDQMRYGDLSIPENVFLIGTVNMDETTHPFSKKVLDRANTLEFNYINLRQYPELGTLEEIEEVTELPKTNHLFLRSDYLQLIDAYNSYQELVVRTTDRLIEVNTLLEDIHAHVGFRVRDTICFYMIYNERFQLLNEDEAFDWQLLQKILPRLQGSHSSLRRVLLNLIKLALGSSSGVTVNLQELMEDSYPLYSKWNSGQTPPEAKLPHSARKLAYMLRRLEEDGFTSYWLS